MNIKLTKSDIDIIIAHIQRVLYFCDKKKCAQHTITDTVNNLKKLPSSTKKHHKQKTLGMLFMSKIIQLDYEFFLKREIYPLFQAKENRWCRFAKETAEELDKLRDKTDDEIKSFVDNLRNKIFN